MEEKLGEDAQCEREWMKWQRMIESKTWDQRERNRGKKVNYREAREIVDVLK